jgi:hypothetical protein
MAAPHVTGLAALLISAEPALAGQVNAIEDAIAQSALKLTTTQLCGTDVPGIVPNNVFGWGRIDALAAYGYVTGVVVDFKMYMPVVKEQ